MPIDRMPIRMQVGGYTLIPGFDHEYFPLNRFPQNSADEVYVRQDLEFAHQDWRYTLESAFKMLRSGGRLDVRVPDYHQLCKEYLEAKTPEERQKVGDKMTMFDKSFTEEYLGAVLQEIGFDRVERLPTKGIHMIAFKP